MARKNKILITDEFKKELKDYITKVSIGIGHSVQNEMTATALAAIDKFYYDYTPTRYKRHYYNFKNKSFRSFYENKHNSIIRAGVKLTPELMDDIYDKSHSHEVTNIVFGLVYSGHHGRLGFGEYVPKDESGFSTYHAEGSLIMSPSPIEIIHNQKYKIINHIGNYTKYGIENANKYSYKFIQ